MKGRKPKIDADDKQTSENEPMPGPTPAKRPLALTPLQATVELVRRGHRDQLPRLRELLRQSPNIFRQLGDLGRQAQHAWADMIAGADHLLRESVVLFADEMKDSLVGPSATRLEKIAAERIVAAWMEAEYFRMWRAQHADADGTKLGELYRKRHEEADRHYERTLKALAEIKRLLPKTIEVTLLPKPVHQPASVPDQHVQDAKVISGTNGYDRLNGKANGHNRLNGHVASLVAPVGAEG